MSSTSITLTPALYTYMLETSLREPEILKALRADTAAKYDNRMQISPEQGQFMRLLIELTGAKKALEIGTFTGYSALAVALALPDSGKLITCDISREWTDIAKTFWDKAQVSHKIELRLDKALHTLDRLLEAGEAETFDFAFIDADKQNYQAYYEKVLPLMRKGGLILVDNVLWGGRLIDEADQDSATVAIRAFNAHVLKDERVTLSMLPLGDGVTLLLKR